MDEEELERDYLEFKKFLDAVDIDAAAQIVADYIFILTDNPKKERHPN